MANAKDLSLDDYKLKVLAYGDFGTGKTRFAATFPKPHYIDFDGGILSLGGMDIDYETFSKDPDRAKKEFERFQKHVRDYVLPKVKDGTFETIVIDSLTTLSEVILNAILIEEKRDHPQLQDWGQQINGLVQIINKLVGNKRCHTIFLAHEQVYTNEDGAIIKGLPLLTGKLAPKVGLYFDEVYRTVAKRAGDSPKFQLQTKATVFQAKSRIDGMLKNLGKPGLPAQVEPPTYATLLGFMKGAAPAQATTK